MERISYLKRMAEEPDERPFRMRVYRKSELAQLYFPYAAKKQALNNLNRWVRSCEARHFARREAGFVKNRCFFPRPELDLFERSLGEP